MQDFDNEIELKDILRKFSEYRIFLWNKKYRIILSVILFSFLSFLVSHFFQEEYKAELTFIVDGGNDRGTMSGGLSGIASQFGFDLGGNSGTTFTQDNIIELLKSREVVSSVLLKESNVAGKKDLLIEHYLNINDLREDLIYENKLVNSFREKLTLHHDSIINLVWLDMIENRIGVKFQSDDASILKLSYISYSQEFAKCMVEELIIRMGIMYTEHRTSQANNTLNFLSDRADSVFNELQISEKAFARTKDINQRIIKASGRLKELQLMREVEVLNTMYLEIIKNLEISKLTLLNNTPIINVIDRPTLPLEDTNMSAVLLVLLGGILGGFFSVMFFVFQKLFRDSLKE